MMLEPDAEESKGLILVADDLSDNLFLMTELIGELLPGITVVTTLSPYEALELAANLEPDGILLDYQMPGMDGIECCIELKKNPQTADIPITLITSHESTPGLRVRGLEAGADDFLARPIDNFELAARIKVMLRIKRAEDQLKRMNQELVSDVKKKNEDLDITRVLLETVIRQAPVPIVAAVPNGRIIFANGAGSNYFSNRKGVEILKGENINKMDLPWKAYDNKGNPIPHQDMPLQAALKGIKTAGKEIRTVSETGDEFWGIWDGVPIFDKHNNLIAGMVIAPDITRQKNVENELTRSLNEKKVLLKEIHHRVKNNLQVIISLLNLQAYQAEDPRVADVFNESKQRIFSMALIHENLYRSGDFTHIDFESYLRQLVREVENSHHHYQRTNMEFDARRVALSIDTAIPLGLIFNELIANAYKHAFPGDQKGHITIVVKTEEDGMVDCRISDNGVGMPDGTNIESTETLGLKLVSILCRQIDAEIKVHKQEGTTVHLRFRSE